jgi:hypothetical protein
VSRIILSLFLALFIESAAPVEVDWSQVRADIASPLTSPHLKKVFQPYGASAADVLVNDLRAIENKCHQNSYKQRPLSDGVHKEIALSGFSVSIIDRPANQTSASMPCARTILTRRAIVIPKSSGVTMGGAAGYVTAETRSPAGKSFSIWGFEFGREHFEISSDDGSVAAIKISAAENKGFEYSVQQPVTEGKTLKKCIPPTDGTEIKDWICTSIFYRLTKIDDSTILMVGHQVQDKTSQFPGKGTAGQTTNFSTGGSSAMLIQKLASGDILVTDSNAICFDKIPEVAKSSGYSNFVNNIVKSESETLKNRIPQAAYISSQKASCPAGAGQSSTTTTAP